MSIVTRITRRRCNLAMVTLGVTVLMGCTPPGKPNPADRHELPGDIRSFDKLFAANCAGCHGANGKFGPAPPLNDPLFVAIASDIDLRKVITKGRLGTPMPAFLDQYGGVLTEEQIEILAKGIQSHWRFDPIPTEALPAYRLARSDTGKNHGELVRRGAEVFHRACSNCHGANGLGWDRGSGMVGGINSPVFLGLISDQAIRRLIITGRPDLGMPNYRGKNGRGRNFQPLTGDDIDALVALIAHWRSQYVLVTHHETE